MRSKKYLLVIVILALIGCDSAEGGGTTGSTTTPSNINNKTITPEITEQTVKITYSDEDYKPIEIYLDDLSFREAFEIEYLAKGKGHTFWWNGNEYTTDMYIDVNTLEGKWVRNSDDIDDSCFYNEWDECGVCNGEGPLTWYFDLDGDGLGDPNTWTKKCFYPSVDEE